MIPGGALTLRTHKDTIQKDTIQRDVSGHWHKWFDMGTNFGPKHLVMGATRYDQNACMIVEVDKKTQTRRWLNMSLVDWNTHYSKPYRGQVKS